MSKSLVDLEHGGEAAEIVLGKPPALLRFSIYLIAFLLLFAALWSYFTKIDIYITAMGSVRPEGDLVKVQTLAGGKILKVFAKEGQAVKEGDRLYLIDGQEAHAEHEKMVSRLENLDQQILSTKEILKNLKLKQQAQKIRDEIALENAKSGQNRARDEDAKALSSLKEAEILEKNAQDEYERHKKLVEQKIISAVELEKKKTELDVAKSRVNSAKASKRISEKNIILSNKEFDLQSQQNEINQSDRDREQKELSTRIQNLESEKTQAELEIVKLKTALENLDVKAATAGTVTAMEFKNPGEIVQAGSVLAAIAPQDVAWIVEAFVPNREAGPLREKVGGPVKLKFDAFDFRDYGTLDGTLIEVSRDATVQENVGPVYRVRVGLKSRELKRGRREGKIQLGMTVTAEIIKEEERVLMLLFKQVRERVSYE